MKVDRKEVINICKQKLKNRIKKADNNEILSFSLIHGLVDEVPIDGMPDDCENLRENAINIVDSLGDKKLFSALVAFGIELPKELHDLLLIKYRYFKI